MYCKHCAAEIEDDVIVCTSCGKQVGELKAQQPQVVINNTNSNVNSNAAVTAGGVKAKNKWVALLLCLFLGIFGGHKFYERKIMLGVLYIFTGGLLGIGVIIDFVRLLFKPNPYYV